MKPILVAFSVAVATICHCGGGVSNPAQLFAQTLGPGTERDPEHKRLVARAFGSLLSGSMTEAEIEFLRAISYNESIKDRYSDGFMLYTNLAVIQSDLNKHAKAETSFFLSINAIPKQNRVQLFDIYYNLSCMYIDVGRYRDAELVTQKCIAIHKEFDLPKQQALLPFSCLAEVYFRAGKLSDTEEVINASTEYGSVSGYESAGYQLRKLRFLTLLHKDRIKEAEDEFRRMQALCPFGKYAKENEAQLLRLLVSVGVCDKSAIGATVQEIMKVCDRIGTQTPSASVSSLEFLADRLLIRMQPDLAAVVLRRAISLQIPLTTAYSPTLLRLKLKLYEVSPYELSSEVVEMKRNGIKDQEPRGFRAFR